MVAAIHMKSQNLAVLLGAMLLVQFQAVEALDWTLAVQVGGTPTFLSAPHFSRADPRGTADMPSGFSQIPFSQELAGGLSENFLCAPGVASFRPVFPLDRTVPQVCLDGSTVVSIDTFGVVAEIPADISGEPGFTASTFHSPFPSAPLQPKNDDTAFSFSAIQFQLQRFQPLMVPIASFGGFAVLLGMGVALLWRGVRHRWTTHPPAASTANHSSAAPEPPGVADLLGSAPAALKAPPDTAAKLSTAHLLADLKGHTLRGAAATVTAQGIKFVLQIVSITALARLLAPADFGLVAMATVVVGLLDRLRDGGLSMATVQRQEISHEQVSNLFWINVCVGAVLTVLLLLISPGLAFLYGEPKLIGIGFALSASFLISNSAVQHEALLNRQMKFSVLARIDVYSMALGVFAAVWTAFAAWGYWSLIAATLVTTTSRAVLVWAASGWLPSGFRRGSGVRPLIHFGMHLTGTNFVGYFASHLMPFVIGLIGGALPLGHFNRANTLVAIPTSQLLPPVMSVARPALCRLAADQDRFRSAGVSLIRKVSLLAMFITVSLFAMADWIVDVFLGPGWETTAHLLRMLSVFALVEPVATVLAMMLIAAGRADVLLNSKFVSIVLVALAVGLAAPWGVSAIVTAYSITGLLIRMPYFIWYTCRYISISPREIYLSIFLSIFAAVTPLIVLLALRVFLDQITPILGVVISTVVATLIYLGVCSSFPMLRVELADISALILRFVGSRLQVSK